MDSATEKQFKDGEELSMKKDAFGDNGGAEGAAKKDCVDDSGLGVLVFPNGQEWMEVGAKNYLSNAVVVTEAKKSLSRTQEGSEDDGKPLAKKQCVDADGVGLMGMANCASSATMKTLTAGKSDKNKEKLEDEENSEDDECCCLCGEGFGDGDPFECPECDRHFHDDCSKICGGEFGLGCGTPMCRDCLRRHALVCEFGPDGAHFVLSEDM